MLAFLPRFALGATLVLPVFLMHGRGIAEVLIALVDVAFLVHCAVARDWTSLRSGVSCCQPVFKVCHSLRTFSARI